MALQVPFVQKYCTCTDEFYNPTHLAVLQKEFEELRLSGHTNYSALEKMKIVRLCCRESLFNPTSLFLNSENILRVKDSTAQKASIKNANTTDIEPKRPFPEFPV